MHPELTEVSKHMRELGLGLLSQAQKNAFFVTFHDRLDQRVFAIIQAAHAAEIFIKACIAEQHPLLIFSSLPKSTDIAVAGELLDIQALFKKGRTIQYKELPEKLWATTGYKIKEVEVYNSFGELRNTIQHFSVPNERLSQITGEFIYKVIDPILGHFWNLYAVEYCDYDEPETHLVSILLDREIDFRSPGGWRD